MHLDDLALDGHHYDPRVLAAPLEFLHLLQQVAAMPRPDRSGLTALLLADLEWQLESIAVDVHRVVSQRRTDTVCTCGVVMEGSDVVTSRGHRDLRTRHLVDGRYVVSHGQDLDERFAVACSRCGAEEPAPTLDRAHVAQGLHECDGLAPVRRIH